MNRGVNRGRRGRGRFRPSQPTRSLSLSDVSCRVLLQKLSDETVDAINNRQYCNLCHRSPSDPLLYGKIYTLGKVTVHYYCLVNIFMMPTSPFYFQHCLFSSLLVTWLKTEMIQKASMVSLKKTYRKKSLELTRRCVTFFYIWYIFLKFITIMPLVSKIFNYNA